MNTVAADAVLQQAAEALRRGDPRGAEALLRRAAADPRADARTWWGLAVARRALGDAAGEAEAADRTLEREPGHLPALIRRADLYAEAGDLRAASAFYGTAVRHAPPPERLPPALQAELRRVEARRAELARGFTEHLRGRMAELGLDDRREDRRVQEALGILTGERQVYVQEPRVFYFPGLPQVQFYDREAFPWLDAVEAATDAIRAELLAVMGDDDAAAFAPYVEQERDRPGVDTSGMKGDRSWSAFFLIRNGRVVEENAARCPATMQAMARAPLAKVEGRTPSVLFSLLRPGARIPPHTGFVNTRLICHLPLVVPEGCGFRVGAETREWREGKAWVFDDTIEHEAWNLSDRPRAILLFDIERPEMTEREREMVRALFAVVDETGPRTEWEL